MMRMLLSTFVLAVTIAWIVLSYSPVDIVSLPQFHFASDDVARLFPPVLLVGFAAFVVLQLWLVQTTARSVRDYNQSGSRDTHGFTLRVGREVFLTALPIVFTVVTALAALGWWQQVIALN
jgi:hypothetical protein